MVDKFVFEAGSLTRPLCRIVVYCCYRDPDPDTGRVRSEEVVIGDLCWFSEPVLLSRYGPRPLKSTGRHDHFLYSTG